LRAAGGAVPFRNYMQWALHDPEHGAYGSGRLQIGPRGDFATSPSLGPAFARLLAPQIVAWLRALPPRSSLPSPLGSAPLALVETGPGEGHLARQLAEELARLAPDLIAQLELVLVEPNPGMVERQRSVLAGAPLPLRWCSWEQLAAQPRRGVMLAHEVLDALAVERVQWDGSRWCRMGVALAPAPDGASEAPSLCWQGSSGGTPEEQAWIQKELAALGIDPPPQPLPPGWCSELHPELEPWLAAAAAALEQGQLLVVDYALEARRYDAPPRREGTLLAYRRQRASPDLLADPGHADLTAHLCLETLQRAATAQGWLWQGECRQGQALLALGLAQALHRLQDPLRTDLLDARLAERESLLRLVDPAGLGEFRWIALARGGHPAPAMPLFLQEPQG
jgi:hypothetical protein